MGAEQSKGEATFAKVEIRHHLSEMSNKLNKLRGDGTFCDVVLWCRGEEFHAHKAVLSSGCLYFRQLFLNTTAADNKVNFDVLHPEGLEKVIDYLYTGRAHITAGSVEYVMQSAVYFKLDAMYDQCQTLLIKELNVENYVYIWNIAEKLSDGRLKTKVVNFCVMNFHRICEQDIFRSLSLERVQCLLNNSNLSAGAEKQLEAVMDWVRGNVYKRKDDVVDLLEILKPEGFSFSFLAKLERSESLLRKLPALKVFVETAMQRTANENVMGRNRKTSSSSNGIEPLILVFTENSKKQTMMQSYRLEENSWSQNQFISPFDVRVTGTTVVNNKIYSVGGKSMEDDNVYLSTLYSYQVMEYQLQVLSPMQVPRAQLSLAFHDGCLYAIGGFNSGGYVASVERYVIASDEWSTVASLNEARSGVTCASVKDRLYAFGGRGLNGIVSVTEYYSASSDQWTVVAPMLFPRSHCGVGVIKNKIYVVGGFWSVQDLLKSSVGCIQTYDETINKWKVLEPTISASAMVTNVVTWQNYMFMLSSAGHVYMFNPEEEKVKKLRRNPHSRNVIRAAYIINENAPRRPRMKRHSRESSGSTKSEY